MANFPSSIGLRIRSWRRARRVALGAVLLGILVGGMALPGTAQTPVKVVPLRDRDDGGRVLRSIERGGTVELSPDQLSSAEQRLRLRWEADARVREALGPHAMPSKGLRMRDDRVRRMLRRGGISTPDTLRLLLIRIAFETDRSGDLTSVTTDGNFQLQPDPDVIIDPPPHDRAYFEAHLRGLGDYWRSMSGGLVVAETRVLPEGDQDAYFLSDIADYGPGAGNFWTIEMLEKLVRDMIEAADAGTQADGSANLADYDYDDPNTYVIFAHAGADLQSNLVFQPGVEGYSPNDIPTFFVSLGDSAQVDLLGSDSDTGEPGRMIECSVIPETTSQDGLTGSIAAALYHEFGHALGLPDLYSTYTGLPTIGYWGIMDSGTNLAAAIAFEDPSAPDGLRVEFVVGLLPPSADIWSKWYLGFTDEVVVGSATHSMNLPASYRQDRRDKVLRLDVSPDEFFLVENRYVPPVVEADWGLVRDQDTGVVQFLGEFAGDTLVGNTHLYDLFLPYAGGLHVWRVRQDRVESKIFDNTVQALPGELGLELIEADGIQDIGVFEFSTIGFYGSDTDAFRDVSTFAYPRQDTTVVWDATATEFGPDTFPPSRSSFRVPTGVRLFDIGGVAQSDKSIAVSARIEGLVDPGTGPGMPIELADFVHADASVSATRGDARSVSFADVGGVPTIVLVAGPADGTQPGSLYAYGLDGAPRFATARVADLDSDPVGPPLFVEAARGTGSDDAWVLVGRDGSLFAATSDAAGFSVTRVAGSDSLDLAPIAVRDSGAAPAWIASGSRRDGTVSVRDVDGNAVAPGIDTGGTELSSNLVEWRDAQGGVHVAVTSGRGLELLRPGGEATSISIPSALRGPARLVSWPREGEADALVIVTEEGTMAQVRPGANAAEADVSLFGRALDGAPVGEPVIGDVDGDGRADLVVATPTRIYALHESGAEVLGFPLAVADHFFPPEPEADAVASAPLVADVDGDGVNEIVLVTRYGLLHAIDSDGGQVDGFPRKASGGGVRAPMIFDAMVGTEMRRGLLLFEALGDTLDSRRRTRAARLNALDLGPAPTTTERPAEWLGFGGGATRAHRGSIGVAASEPTAVSLAERRTVVYPNPLDGSGSDRVFLRFFSGQPHTCTLTVYNLEGEEVLTVRRAVDATGVPAVMDWSAAGLQSGPYLCRLDYVGAEGPATDVVTLFVER